MGKHICANKTTAILNSLASSPNMLMGEENWDPYPEVVRRSNEDHPSKKNK